MSRSFRLNFIKKAKPQMQKKTIPQKNEAT